jgi:hypothetical protein
MPTDDRFSFDELKMFWKGLDVPGKPVAGK